jgi:DnaJ-class molecular chaperone
MKNYYEILNVNINSSKNDIKKSYKDHISRFNGLPFLTDKMISEIKEFKKAYYILGDEQKKYIYDNRLKPKKTVYQPSENNDDFIENTKINDRLFGNIFNK